MYVCYFAQNKLTQHQHIIKSSFLCPFSFCFIFLFFQRLYKNTTSFAAITHLTPWKKLDMVMEITKHYDPLFETKSATERVLFWLYAASIFISICMIWIYRLSYFPLEGETELRWTWLSIFLSELWFSWYWFLTVVISGTHLSSYFQTQTRSQVFILWLVAYIQAQFSWVFTFYYILIFEIPTTPFSYCIRKLQVRGCFAKNRHICLHGWC